MSSDARKMAEESLRSCIRAMNEWAAQEDGLPDTAADAVEEALSALSLLASEPAPPADAEVARLTALLRECNAVCLCGCPASEHESYGEDGESCADEGHECIRVAPAVLAYVNKLRSARALPPEVEAAAEVVVRGDWWGHYCPSCGSTAKHGPECRIGRLAKALSSARAAKGGAE